jgi:hypothetical protein
MKTISGCPPADGHSKYKAILTRTLQLTHINRHTGGIGIHQRC